MKLKCRAFRFTPLTLLFFALILLPGEATAQAQGKRVPADKNAYVNEEHRYSIVPPSGFAPMSAEEIRQVVIPNREKFDLPEVEGSPPIDRQINQMMFKPPEFDPALRSLVIIPKAPPFKVLEEFESQLNLEIVDLVTVNRESTRVNGRPCFILDREFDKSGIRIRQLCCYVPDFLPQGFLINFSAVAVEFEEYREGFIKSLKTFRIAQPEMSPEMKKSRYTGGRRRKQAQTWRSLEVIGSLLFVAVFAILFLVKQLSAGAVEDEAAELPGTEEGQPSDPGGPPPVPDAPQDEGGEESPS